MRTLAAVAVALLLWGNPSGATSPEHSGPLVGVPRISDGDSLRLAGQRVRLHGMDAPETHQICTHPGGSWRCGEVATEHLRGMVGGQVITCDPKQRDSYERVIAVCRTPDGTDLGRWMVEQGLAVAYRHFSMNYVEAEEQARATGLGIWAGTFELPWVWRRANRAR